MVPAMNSANNGWVTWSHIWIFDYFPLFIQVKSPEFQPRSTVKCSGNGKHRGGLHASACYKESLVLWQKQTPLTAQSPRAGSLCPDPQLQANEMDTPRILTSFSDELADRSTSWASKNSDTDSDMERRLSLATCCDRGRLTWICSPAYRKKRERI